MSLRLFTYRALVYIFGPYKGIFPSICFFFFHCLKHLWGYLAQLRHLQTIQKNSFWLHKQSCFQGSTRALLQSFAITRAVICWTVTTATESQYCSIVICRTDVITCCQSAAKELRYSLQHYVLQSCDITNRPSLPALMTGGGHEMRLLNRSHLSDFCTEQIRLPPSWMCCPLSRAPANNG